MTSLRGKHFPRQRVGLSAVQIFRHVEFVGTISSGHLLGICDLLAVEPDIRPVINAHKIQPAGFFVTSSRYLELRAIPPRTVERASCRHIEIRKECLV